MYRILLILMLISASPAFAQTESDQSKWDIYLDHAYEFTYWEDEELQGWLTERENEFGQSLSQFADTWHKKLKEQAPQAGGTHSESDRLSYPEQAYKRLALAEFLLYLRRQESKHLNEATQVLEQLSSKLEKPEIAFWYYFIHAHAALSKKGTEEEKDAGEIVKNVFRIWLDVILPQEEVHTILNIPGTARSMKDFAFSLPYLYENIADLILNKAIIKHELTGIGSLGVVIRGLNERLSIKNGYAENVNAIVNRMNGPKSDSNHLNFTVIFLEAEKYRFDAQKKLNEEGPSAHSEKAFRKSQYYYNLAYKWANTKQGNVAVISDYLDMVSFMYSRMPERGKLESSYYFATFSEHKGALTIEQAVNLFEELAGPDTNENEWNKHGFSMRKDYITAMHGLWNSIVELSLWSAYYHEKGIVWTDIKSYADKVNRCQAELLLHLDFFQRNVKNGYKEVIPENAYYNAAEAAAKYSAIYHRLAPYSSGMKDYYHAFVRLLQYVEIFPYDPEAVIELARQLNEMGNLDLYVQYVVPVAGRLKGSAAIQDRIKNNGGQPYMADLEKLQRIMPEIILKANTIIYLRGKGADKVKEDITLRVKEIQGKSGFIRGGDVNLKPDDFNSLKEKLEQISHYLTSKNNAEEEVKGRKLLEEITKLKREIQELQEADQVTDTLPDYIETSKRIRMDLAQKIDHPIHMMLRQFFHEVSPDKKSYSQTLNVIAGVRE